jgi:hypothetical protein
MIGRTSSLIFRYFFSRLFIFFWNLAVAST